MSMESVMRKVCALSIRQIVCLMMALQLVTLGMPMPVNAHGNGGNTADNRTRTPIKHVIVIIGENRTFDHLFATYKPKNHQTIWNLRSEGIVNEDGTPGPNYSLAEQDSALDLSPSPFEESPMGKSLFPVLPPVLTGGPKAPLFSTVAQAQAAENGLAPGYYQFLTTGGTGQASSVPDARISYNGEGATMLPDGPFQLTPGVPYDAYAGSPVHRFYQMWQQEDCNSAYATQRNPSGCKADLFPWVEVTIGAGSNGKLPGSPAYDAPSGEGATAMGFYNMAQGDVPYFKYLADHYSFSDNYHQAVMGGTGANHIMLGTGYAIPFTDGKGNAITPPSNEIEDPDPQTGTNNWYTQDGYSGGTYSECADATQPGVAEIDSYLASLARPINPNCQAGNYYLLNNYNPGYYGDGTVAFGDPKGMVFTVPPSPVRTIGDDLLAANISWKYYGDGWNNYVADQYNPNNTYCNICNFEQYATSIMTNAAVRTAHLQDTANLYTDIANGNLPAVSFVKPSGLVDGHPASSKFDLFEGFVKKIVDGVQANPKLWASTAIFITVDEGGGYYDSGYVQPLDFFGDGTRIPLIVVSAHTDAGHISHEYADHVSILKFIEANWNLPPVSSVGRDNLPNPLAAKNNPYVPENSPAISDLMDLFDFGHGNGHGQGNGH
ncbi:MAG TPA: alkaline phosphatase family protein [Candidatus Acidoferrales bacterium]|nr:alkaline phosphatase family protein [Candidatus Acidoferrales bacterium]